MASVSKSTSSSVYNSLGIKNTGIGGLATGLDTDSLVEALVSGTKSKIAKQGQDKQLLNWKMTAYRSMATALTAFQKKSFSMTSSSSTNIMSASFFNTYKASATSGKVSVATTSSSYPVNFQIDKIEQLATAETLTSSAKLSTDLLLNVTNGQAMDANAFTGETLSLNVNGSTKTIKLDSLNSAIVDGKLNLEKFKDGLQGLINENFTTKYLYNEETDKYDKKTSNVTVSVSDGKIKLDSDSAQIKVTADNRFLGVSGGKSNRVDLYTKISDISAFEGIQGDILKFNINGTEISINKDETLNSLMTKIKNSDAGVNISYSTADDNFTLTSKTTGGGQNIVIRDTQGNLMSTLFGTQSGNGVGSNFLSTVGNVTSQNANTFADLTSGSEAMKKLATDLGNMQFEMTINGVTKTVKVDTTAIDSTLLSKGTFTLDDVYKAMNKGITNSFDGTTVKFVAGADGKTEIYSPAGSAVSVGGTGKAMELMGFSGKTGNNMFDFGYDSSISAANAITDGKFSGGITMTINGVTKQLDISDADYKTSATKLNAAITTAFGKDIAAKVSFKSDPVRGEPTDDNENGEIIGAKLILDIKDPNMAVTVGNGSTSKGNVDIYGALGFGGTEVNNYPLSAGGTTFGDLKEGQNFGTTNNTLTIQAGDGTAINVSYNKNTSIQDFLADINKKLDGKGSAGIQNGQLYIKANGDNDLTISDTGTMLKDVFGMNSSSYTTSGASSEIKRVEGQNAIVVVDGREISWASNTISIGGVNVTLNEASGVDDVPIKVNVVSDPDDVVKRIQSWMDDYNALVYTLNSMINESKNKDYSPLTDEQKAEMTEDQIKVWEAEAKKGILRNDGTLRGILDQLRASLYEKVESAGISIFDLGITTKSGMAGDVNEAGQLEFDPNITGGGESKLRTLLETNPDKVRLFFTDSTQGLAVRMNDIIDRAARESSVNRGTLVTLAGTERSTGNNTSVLGDKISAIDKYITTLKSRMESEYNRYWKKFSALEVAVQKMNSQSSWLNQ